MVVVSRAVAVVSGQAAVAVVSGLVAAVVKGRAAVVIVNGQAAMVVVSGRVVQAALVVVGYSVAVVTLNEKEQCKSLSLSKEIRIVLCWAVNELS